MVPVLGLDRALALLELQPPIDLAVLVRVVFLVAQAAVLVHVEGIRNSVEVPVHFLA